MEKASDAVMEWSIPPESVMCRRARPVNFEKRMQIVRKASVRRAAVLGVVLPVGTKDAVMARCKINMERNAMMAMSWPATVALEHAGAKRRSAATRWWIQRERIPVPVRRMMKNVITRRPQRACVPMTREAMA